MIQQLKNKELSFKILLKLFASVSGTVLLCLLVFFTVNLLNTDLVDNMVGTYIVVSLYLCIPSLIVGFLFTYIYMSWALGGIKSLFLCTIYPLIIIIFFYGTLTDQALEALKILEEDLNTTFQGIGGYAGARASALAIIFVLPLLIVGSLKILFNPALWSALIWLLLKLVLMCLVAFLPPFIFLIAKLIRYLLKRKKIVKNS